MGKNRFLRVINFLWMSLGDTEIRHPKQLVRAGCETLSMNPFALDE